MRSVCKSFFYLDFLFCIKGLLILCICLSIRRWKPTSVVSWSAAQTKLKTWFMFIPISGLASNSSPKKRVHHRLAFR